MILRISSYFAGSPVQFLLGEMLFCVVSVMRNNHYCGYICSAWTKWLCSRAALVSQSTYLMSEIDATLLGHQFRKAVDIMQFIVVSCRMQSNPPIMHVITLIRGVW